MSGDLMCSEPAHQKFCARAEVSLNTQTWDDLRKGKSPVFRDGESGPVFSKAKSARSLNPPLVARSAGTRSEIPITKPRR